MWTAGPDGAPDFWNRWGDDYTGAGPDRPLGWNDLIHPDDLHQARTEWAVAILTGGELVTSARGACAAPMAWSSSGSVRRVTSTTW
jgi:hypothetical protein